MLRYTDHRDNPSAWATELGISDAAIELYLGSDVIDLHVDSFIWHRIFGYDLRKRHGRGLFGARFYSQVDFPRIREAAITGCVWVISTNPGRSAAGRAAAFVRNIHRLQSLLESEPEHFALVRNLSEYRAARAAGKHGAFIGIQGGNALDESIEALDLIPDGVVLRITLVHLTSSRIGITSTPRFGTDTGLTDFGRDYVKRLNEKRIFVDLAHISKKSFADAVEVHDKSQPLIVTHTGVDGVFPHWRNLNDGQLRAIADTGGTIGIIYQPSFLGDPFLAGSAQTIVDHLAHIVDTVGEDHASLGSDWDGAISTPRDMQTCLELPRMVQMMLDRGWSDTRIAKILGGNFLRAVGALRGES